MIGTGSDSDYRKDFKLHISKIYHTQNMCMVYIAHGYLFSSIWCTKFKDILVYQL